MKNLMNLIALLGLFSALTAQASTTPVGVARTAKDAILKNFDGQILITSSALTLNLEGVQNEYKLSNGVCFGAVTTSGCSYASTEPGQPDISVEFRCVSRQGALTTYQIGDLRLYSYALAPQCQLMPSASRHTY